MCSICGILYLSGRSVPERDLTAMSRVLRHRGPDDQGVLASGPLAMAFRRLSIVDVAGGHQPMANEDGSIWIVFNVQIYNAPYLLPFLPRHVHCYATTTHREPLLL